MFKNDSCYIRLVLLGPHIKKLDFLPEIKVFAQCF